MRRLVCAASLAVRTVSKQRRTKTASWGKQFQPIEQPWHVEKTCREALERISAEVRLSILADNSTHKFRDLYVSNAHLETCSFEEFGRADAIARREPVVSILPFLLYCAAVSMAHLTVGGETLRQAAG